MYWFQPPTAVGAHRVHPQIKIFAMGATKIIDFKSIFIDLVQKYWYEINIFSLLWAPTAVGG